MDESKYEVKQTARFKKDYRLAQKRGEKMALLKEIVALLACSSIGKKKMCLC
jgi:mRNA-degrading endonuclease YafQ of YafQ-DinJ toxin-antitoxin module